MRRNAAIGNTVVARRFRRRFVRCTAAAFLLAGVARAQAVAVGPERFVSKPVHRVHASEQGQTAVVSNGTTALAVWMEKPDNAITSGPDGSTLVAARVAADGTQLDPGGIVLSPLPEGRPSNFFAGTDGSGFIVVWRTPNGDLKAVRTNAQGALLGGTVTIGGTGTDPFVFARAIGVAGLNGEYLVTWNTSFGLAFARIGADGTVLDAPAKTLSSVLGSTDPRVVTQNGRYFVTWKEPSGVRGVHLSKEGAVLGTGPFTISAGPASQPSVTGNGTDYFVVWTDGRSGTPDVHGARVTASGGVEGAAVPIAVGPRFQTNPRVAFASGQYLVGWEDRETAETGTVADLQYTRVSRAGAVLDAPARTLRANVFVFNPEFVRLGAAFYGVYEFNNTLSGLRIGNDGVLLDTTPSPLNLGRMDETAQSLTSNGDTYYLWENEAFVGTRLDDSGVALDTARTSFDGFAERTFASVESDGQDYLAAWVENHPPPSLQRSLRTSRILADGTVEAPVTARDQSVAASQPTLVRSGSGYLDVWCEANGVIHLTSLKRDGTLAAGGDRVLFNGSFVPDCIVGVASGLNGHLVTFSEIVSETEWRLLGVRVRPDGTVLDRTPLVLPAAPSGRDAGAAGEGEWMLPWSEPVVLPGSPGERVHPLGVARLGFDGSMAGAAIELVAPARTPPLHAGMDIASDGTDHVLTWTRTGGAGLRAVLGARIRANSSTVEPFTVAEFPGDPLEPDLTVATSVASNGPGKFLVVYSRYVRESRSLQRATRTIRFATSIGDGGPDADSGAGGVPQDGGDAGPGGTTGTGGGAATPTGGAGGMTSGSGGRLQGGASSGDGGPVAGSSDPESCDCAIGTRSRGSASAGWVALLGLLTLRRRSRCAAARLRGCYDSSHFGPLSRHRGRECDE